jgi:hypothetical protein
MAEVLDLLLALDRSFDFFPGHYIVWTSIKIINSSTLYKTIPISLQDSIIAILARLSHDRAFTSLATAIS